MNNNVMISAGYVTFNLSNATILHKCQTKASIENKYLHRLKKENIYESYRQKKHKDNESKNRDK